MKNICVVTGYRSDYTKLKSVLHAISTMDGLHIQIVVFGAHLLGDHGHTFENIESDGYVIAHKCATNIEGDTPLTMSKSIGFATIELASAFEKLDPDIVLIVGDRYEILAAAIAASIGNIPVAHIQGGEVSGTIDETIRHTITKLSHVHFPSTELSKKRVLLLGEDPTRVFNVGCPAVDYIKNIEYVSRKNLKCVPGLSRLKINFEKPYIILIQHPVTTECSQAGDQMQITLEALQECGVQTILIYPNPDAGAFDMLRAIRQFSRKNEKESIICNKYKNLPFESYLNLLKNSNCLVGNSSSGIREAAEFGIPVVNIGNRQLNRERTSNIVDVDHNKNEIIASINKSLHIKKIYDERKIYGNGRASEKIAQILFDTLYKNPVLPQKKLIFDRRL
jgi:UDP-N-acetylglucosamine 2-epimerase (non-hydrolysing)/GDP/UDP-N,N'-diacetylbacillosamine 2-epimerase (hydrolysing)